MDEEEPVQGSFLSMLPRRRGNLRLTPAFYQNNTNLDVNRIRRFKK
jgi:hypothetical protein